MAPRQYNLGKRAAAVEETRRRIVDAIVALHAEKGVLGTSVEDIARRADVALGTVQRHFPSVDDILGACGPRIIEITRPPKPELFAGLHSPSQRVKALVQELFSFYERAAPWLEIAHCERKKLAALDDKLSHLEQQLEATVREALRPAKFDDNMMRSVVALTDFYVWKSFSSHGLGEQGADLISKLLLYCLDGLAPQDEKVIREPIGPSP